MHEFNFKLDYCLLKKSLQKGAIFSPCPIRTKKNDRFGLVVVEYFLLHSVMHKR